MQFAVRQLHDPLYSRVLDTRLGVAAGAGHPDPLGHQRGT